MLPGLRGPLVSEEFAAHLLEESFRGRLGESTREAARRAIARLWRQSVATLGPASSLRAIFDLAAIPLLGRLGFHIEQAAPAASGALLAASMEPPEDRPLGLIIAAWGDPLDRVWREAVRHAVRLDARWCFCFNGRELRIVETERAYARSYVEFCIEPTLESDETFAAFWGLLRAEAFQPAGVAPARERRFQRSSLFDEAVERSTRHARAVSGALKEGVLGALSELLGGLAARHLGTRRGGLKPGFLPAALEQSLTVVYRILFLLFAEARGLVPVWHPIYRHHYSIESLRDLVESPRRPRGVWEALQAIARLAHAGCHAGDLRMTPFNGRLFAPGRTPLAESCRLDDEAAARALRALSTTRGRQGVGRERIAYRDLGVEQLGAVYEDVLDYEPHVAPPPPGGGRGSTRSPAEEPSARPRISLRRGGGRRKATGTFYTPTTITDYLVRRTLHPLVHQASTDEILRLRILDPSMGSGAFLVSACRYLASHYEAALAREETCRAGDLGEDDRAGIRRRIAQACVFGVDLNPMAVQLARLSMWLATLAADRPLTFLDHHLLAGNSLVGASLNDLARQPPTGPGRSHARRPARLPLFDTCGADMALEAAVPERTRIALEPGETIDAVRAKERALASLTGRNAPLARWKAIADLWCAGWFWEPEAEAPGGALFAELADAIRSGRSLLRNDLVSTWLDRSRAIARAYSFFHWTLEFPEVFFDSRGRPLAEAGFDAVLGNPPWDMIRADAADEDDRSQARASVHRLLRFARASGVYGMQSDGHANLYQLFVERALALVRRGGRLGLVLPGGLVADQGCARLRRCLLERCDTDTLVTLDNRTGIFPIHRSVRFLLLTTTVGARTSRIHCRFGERDVRTLDSLPDSSTAYAPGVFPITLTPELIARLSGPDLAIPDFRSQADVALVDKISSAFAPLESDDGWGARFGRELNATEDRRHFVRLERGLPVVEGKQLEPFIVNLSTSRFRIPEDVAGRLLDPVRSYRRARLAYRDVASATNRLTLIAAIVQAGCVTTHTLFCLKTPLDADEQAFLCGMFNSFVANYLVRLRVSTHVTTAIVERLPMPHPPRDSSAFQEMASLATKLAGSDVDALGRAADHARLQVLAARAYDLTPAEFAHVLETFPLVPKEDRDAAFAAFENL